MKKTLLLTVSAAIALVAPTAFAAEGDVKTISGTGLCAKCELKETDNCQNAIQTEEGGKKVTYYLIQNDVAKSFHKQICKESKEVTATGTVKENDGKMMFTATKIEAK